MNGQQIKHFPEFLLLQEGENFTTYCNFSSNFYNLQWYKQRPGSSPVLLMILAKSGEVKTQQRLTVRFGESRQHSSLHLTAAQPSDTGTYFCAATQCSGSTCCLSPNLTVGSRGCPASTPLREGARESWSHDVYEETEFLIKKVPGLRQCYWRILSNTKEELAWITHNFLQKIEENNFSLIFWN